MVNVYTLSTCIWLVQAWFLVTRQGHEMLGWHWIAAKPQSLESCHVHLPKLTSCSKSESIGYWVLRQFHMGLEVSLRKNINWCRNPQITCNCKGWGGQKTHGQPHLAPSEESWRMTSEASQSTIRYTMFALRKLRQRRQSLKKKMNFLA